MASIRTTIHDIAMCAITFLDGADAHSLSTLEGDSPVQNQLLALIILPDL